MNPFARMRLPAAILVTLALASMPARTHPTSPHAAKTPAEIRADSLYDAGATDSLRTFAQHLITRAAARRDTVLLGRMIFHRGRARLALRDPRASEDFDRALALAVATGDSSGRMQALGLQAFVAVNRGHFDDSIRLNRERIALARALHRRASEGWGFLLIGYAQFQRGSLAEAFAAYEEAWRAFRDAGRPREQLSASIGLANTLARMGRFRDARTSYQRAWLAARELGDRNQESDAINDLGVLEQEHGQLSLASAYFERAYEIKRDLRTFDIAAAARNVAVVDQMIGRYAHAESTLAQALALGSSKNVIDVGLAVDLGRIRLAQERNASAARCFRDVLAQRSRLPAKTLTEASTFLAEALLAVDSIPAAARTMEGQMARVAQSEPSLWRSESLLMCARCRRALGDTGGARGAALLAWQDAVARSDSSVMVNAACAMSLCERAAGHEANALQWLERGRRAFEAARTAGEFQWREARRATLAGALIESGDVLRVHPAGATEEVRMRALFDFLQQVQSRTLLERVTDPRRFKDVNPALVRPPTSRELQAATLSSGECLLLASVAPGRVYVFALTPDAFRADTIDDPDGALQRRVRNYERLCACAPEGDGPQAIDAASRALGEMLFAGTADVVRASSRVYASLDGFLAGFPMETVVCPGEEVPLGVAHETVRVPSAAILAWLRARPDPAPLPPSVYAVASGVPALAGARAEVDHLVARYGATRAITPGRGEFLAALSGYDVVHIASHVHVDGERPWNSGILIGAAPVPPAPGERDSTGAGPLVLSSAESRRVERNLPDDPFVRASEIANRRTHARLVVLSACESALGRATVAEGVLGIASSFVSAGSRAVVGSLWEVDDRTTAELMQRFYAGLAQGRTVAAALQGARLEIRKRHPAPFFWAGFVVIGDGDLAVPVHRRPRAAPAAAALAGLIFVLAGLSVIWRRRRARVRITA